MDNRDEVVADDYYKLTMNVIRNSEGPSGAAGNTVTSTSIGKSVNAEESKEDEIQEETAVQEVQETQVITNLTDRPGGDRKIAIFEGLAIDTARAAIPQFPLVLSVPNRKIDFLENFPALRGYAENRGWDVYDPETFPQVITSISGTLNRVIRLFIQNKLDREQVTPAVWNFFGVEPIEEIREKFIAQAEGWLDAFRRAD